MWCNFFFFFYHITYFFLKSNHFLFSCRGQEVEVVMKSDFWHILYDDNSICLSKNFVSYTHFFLYSVKGKTVFIFNLLRKNCEKWLLRVREHLTSALFVDTRGKHEHNFYCQWKCPVNSVTHWNCAVTGTQHKLCGCVETHELHQSSQHFAVQRMALTLWCY